jgi:hypothetical protein
VAVVEILSCLCSGGKWCEGSLTPAGPNRNRNYDDADLTDAQWSAAGAVRLNPAYRFAVT